MVPRSAYAIALCFAVGAVVCPSYGAGVPPDTAAHEIGEPVAASPWCHLTQGVARTVGPWDLSLVALGMFDYIRAGDDANRITLEPFGFDRQLARSLGRDDAAELLGSRVAPATIQTTLFLGQLLTTTALDLTGQGGITARDYERPLVFAKVLLYTYAVTEFTKGVIKRERPDGSNGKSFFSGHASGSFAASAFVFRELNDWFDGIEPDRSTSLTRTFAKGSAFTLCYGWATYVAYARLHDNKHYLSDVLVGALVASLMANLMYDAHFGKPEESQQARLRIGVAPSLHPRLFISYHL